MTSSPNEPLEFSGPLPVDGPDENPNEDDTIVDPESELAGSDGYDDRQEGPAADHEDSAHEDGRTGA